MNVTAINVVPTAFNAQHGGPERANDTNCLPENLILALGYGLDDRGSRVRFQTGAGNFTLHHRVQTGSGAQPASYPMGARSSFPGGRAAGA
jgi:hypothetical protein